MERVGARRELGFAILLTCVSAVSALFLAIGWISEECRDQLILKKKFFGLGFWVSRLGKRRQHERMKMAKTEELELYRQ